MSDALMKSSELRKLVRMFNKATKITIPKGLKGQGEMIKFLGKHGEINHKAKMFLPSTNSIKSFKLSDYDKMFPPKTTEQKAEAKQKATTRKESSEANMVKSLQGKGYTVTKSKPSEKKPTPAPKKPAKSAPTPAPKKATGLTSGLKPSEKKMTEKEKAIFLKDLREQSLKILIDVDLKDTTEEYRTAEAFRKKRMKMKPNIKEEHEQRKIDNDKILERLKLIAGVVADKQKEAQKKPKKAPAKKAPAKKAPAKKAPVSGKVSDSEFMKRPAFKFLLKNKTELYDTIIKLNKQRISGKLDEEKMGDMIDKAFDKNGADSAKGLNKMDDDDIVFKLGSASARSLELMNKRLKKKIDEANTLKKKGGVIVVDGKKKKQADKQTLKELVANIKERADDDSVDEDGDSIFSEKSKGFMRSILNVYKSLPYKLHKDEELYKLMDQISGYRGDEGSAWAVSLKAIEAYAKSKK